MLPSISSFSVAAHVPLTSVAPADQADVSYGWLGDAVVAVMEAIGPIGVGLAVLIENIFPPIPSELFLALAGFTAASGAFTVWEAVLWATVGSVVGAALLYGLGAWFGRRRLYRAADWLPLVDIDDVEKTERWFLRFGNWTVFVGRMVPIFRSLISIPAGVERMHMGLFLLLTTVGSGIWNTLFIGGGFLLGENFHLISDYADVFSNVILGLVVAAIVVWVTLRVLRNRRRAQDPNYQPPSADEAARRIDALVQHGPGRK